MELALGIVVVVAIIALCTNVFVKMFMEKHDKAKNPCAGCIYHECLMTHGVCDRLGKDATNLK